MAKTGKDLVPTFYCKTYCKTSSGANGPMKHGLSHSISGVGGGHHSSFSGVAVGPLVVDQRLVWSIVKDGYEALKEVGSRSKVKQVLEVLHLDNGYERAGVGGLQEGLQRHICQEGHPKVQRQ